MSWSDIVERLNQYNWKLDRTKHAVSCDDAHLQAEWSGRGGIVQSIINEPDAVDFGDRGSLGGSAVIEGEAILKVLADKGFNFPGSADYRSAKLAPGA